ncbi:ABC transporter permease [Adhaeribacter sp. BT258]|uniref:ABC transporter permease n=1 Tax=Adhaeribacter terrigena TaxID=2793070 RepID=A0ABS1BXE6_9BACT|nr:ABC transporter permease [Adhaeribacter terrigena]MBK0401744.1 ABC transporter permease [Adhaeribacter terrigena]
MHKIWLIVQREYLTRVRKKSFIIMTLVGPLLMAALMVVPIWLTTISDDSETIEVLDESGLFAGKFQNEGDLKFKPVSGSVEAAKKRVMETENTALLYIPKINLDKPEGIKLFSQENTSLTTQIGLEKMLKREIEEQKFARSGVDKKVLDQIKTDISISTVNMADGDEKSSNAAVTSAAGYIGAILIYMFIFIYGVQIMRGVIEEKTNRIVEVVISSVKPFQLMMGKILGIAAVGLTQFLLWIMLSTAIVSVVSSQFKVDRFSDEKIEETLKTTSDAGQAKEMHDIFSAINNLNVPLLLGCFLFYFLGGYLLYGALFGAVGSAVDNETDTQQFLFPITIPLIMSFIVAQTVIIKNPDGPVAFWMSVIPFTSPISMMLRLPFGVPTWQLLLSMAMLILGFIFTVWLAGRIYRVGILMYGKKVNYRELSKWLFYKG